jgi:hypothetical protein
VPGRDVVEEPIEPVQRDGFTLPRGALTGWARPNERGVMTCEARDLAGRHPPV